MFRDILCASTDLRRVSGLDHRRKWLVSCCHRAPFQRISSSTAERPRTSSRSWWTSPYAFPRKWSHRCRQAPTSSAWNFRMRTRCATSRSSSSPLYAPLAPGSSGGSPPFSPSPPRISNVFFLRLGFVWKNHTTECKFRSTYDWK